MSAIVEVGRYSLAFAKLQHLLDSVLRIAVYRLIGLLYFTQFRSKTRMKNEKPKLYSFSALLVSWRFIAALAAFVMIAIFSRSDIGARLVRAQEPCLLKGRGEVGTIMTTARPFDRWALVIGVSRFRHGDKEIAGRQISNLRGPENDSRAIRDFLLTPEGGGFPPNHIRIARNEEATRAAVI